MEQRLGARRHREVARLAQERERPAPHLGVGVVEQAAQRGVRGRRLAAAAEQLERVQDLLGVDGTEPRREHLGRLAVEDRSLRALGVELVLLQALLERRHVAVVDARGEHQPDPDRGQRHEAQVPGRKPAERRERQHRQPASASPARHATVSMKDFAGSLIAVGTGRYRSSIAGRSIE